MRTERSDIPPIEPQLSLAEREELAHIAYFLAQLERLRDCHLVSPADYPAIVSEYTSRRESIERRGQAEAALSAARALSRQGPQDALVWADRARKLDPAREEAWTLAIDLHTRLRHYEDACACCAEAVQRFPALQSRLDALRREQGQHEAALQRAREQEMRDRAVADLLAKAKTALASGRGEDVVSLCSQVLAIQAGNGKALSLLALAQDRLGNFDEAIAGYRELQRLQPAEGIWLGRVREVQRRKTAARRAEAAASPAAPPALAPERALTWASIAGEFLKEHWQKLILCLAVLLIVVSSTLGAHHLLGPLLWSPEGKCILALVYTLVFASFGCGLVKWGAQGAGRMVLLTTVIVVPVNFALAGELRLLLIPTVSHVLTLALSAAALWLLVRLILSALESRRMGLVAFAFFGLSVFNSVIGPGIAFGWGFAAFVLLAWMFLGGVWAINTHTGDLPADRGLRSVYLALGLLAYAFLFGELRAGVLVLHLIPALYALPVMLAAIACVFTATTRFAGTRLPRHEKEAHRVHLLGYIGYVLAGAAFALALARPPDPSALLSGNTLATALLGLGLFAASMRATRHPAYLYCAFAALFVVYVGAGHFIGDGAAAIEDMARRALGYEHRLPLPFKSLNGLAFNTVLALLSLLFARRWKDRRLACHCHFIGLPLSLAACGSSCFEPKAAMLCLSAYAALYGIAVWLFEQPLLIYLACAAFAGAAFFVSTLVPVMTIASQALGAAGVGLVFWAVSGALALRGVREAYRAPLVHATLIMSGVAVWGATAAVLPPPHVSSAATLAFFVVALLALLSGTTYPCEPLSYLAVTTGSIGYLLAVIYANRKLQLHLSPAQLAIAAAVASATLCGRGEWLKRVAQRNSDRQELVRRLSLYVFPLFHLALVQVALAVALCSLQLLQQPTEPAPNALAAISIALAICTGTLVMVSTFAYRATQVAYLAVWTGAAAYANAVLGGLTAIRVHGVPAAMAVAFGALGLLLHIAGERTARVGVSDQAGSQRSERRSSPHPSPLIPHPSYRQSLLNTAFTAVGLTWLLCGLGWSSYPVVAIALVLTTVTLAASTRVHPVAPLAHLATASALGVWLSVFEWAIDEAVAAPAAYGVVVGAFALALLAVAEGMRRWASEEPRTKDEAGPDLLITYPSSLVSRLFRSSLPDFTLAALFASVGLAAWPVTNGPAVIATLLLTSLALLRSTRFKREVALVYLSLGSATAAALCFCGLLQGGADPGVGLASLGLTAALVALGLWVAGFVCRRKSVDSFYAYPCFAMSLLLTAGGFALVAAACLASPAALALCAVELLIDALVCLLLTAVWRRPALTYSAVLALAAAAHLAPLAVGTRHSAFAGGHGTLAGLEAIALWLIGFVCRRHKIREWDDLYSRPLDVSSLILTLLAVPLSLISPAAMLLVAVSFLLMIKGFPSTGWLYAVVAAVACSVHRVFFTGPPGDRLVIASLAAAFALWALGVVVQRLKPAMCGRLNLRELGYELPLFNGALAASAVVIVLRVAASALRGDAWTAHVVLLPALALFYLLMLKAYPHRAWVHLSAGLVTLSLALETAPFLRSYPEVGVAAGWLLATTVAAHLWRAVWRGLERVETSLCRRLGVSGDQYSEVIRDWSRAIFTGAALLASALVIVTTLTAVFALPPLIDVAAAGGWWCILAALLLIGLYALLRPSYVGVEGLLLGAEAMLVLLVWWAGAPSSPLMALLGARESTYYPLATAGLGLLTVIAGGCLINQGQQTRLLGGLDKAATTRMTSFVWQAGTALTVIGLAFTKGVIDLGTVLTLVLATASFAVLTGTHRRVGFTYASSGVFVMACCVAILSIVGEQGVSGIGAWAVDVALALMLAAFALLAGAAWLRKHHPAAEISTAEAAPKSRTRAPVA